MNIVFDLGGVVFNWQPETIIRSVFTDTDTQDIVRREVFQHPDWVELDKGTLTFEQAVRRASSRSGLARHDIERLLNAVPQFLTPIETTIELIRQLSHAGNRLFVLSNMQLASIEHLERKHTIWELFEGVVISSRIRMVKPEPEIFDYLLQHHELEPADTLFIDDMQENVAAASSAGIQAVRYVNPAQCARALSRALAATARAKKSGPVWGR